MKTISKNELIRMDVCDDVLNRFIEQTNNTDAPVLIESLFKGKNTASDFIWLAGEICDIEKIKKFARDIALVNIELIKLYCNESDYNLILNFLKTGENADAVYTATYYDAHDANEYHEAAYAAVYAAAIATYHDADYVAHAAHAALAVSGRVDFTPHLQELFS